MPSQLHESHLLLFRNQPTLAAELIRIALGARVPSYREARVISADLTDIQPAEYRADMVVELFDGTSVLGIVVEVQLSVDERKQFVWPVYVATLRARLQCPVCLLVITASEAVARWAAKTVELGGGNWFAPYVISPSHVPEVVDHADAHANPELAAQTYEYQSDFARHYVAQGEAVGRAKGEASGRVTLITRQLTTKFGPLSTEAREQIQNASVAQLEAIGDRLLDAATLQEILHGG